jgi:hypothetical protein
MHRHERCIVHDHISNRLSRIGDALISDDSIIDASIIDDSISDALISDA